VPKKPQKAYKLADLIRDAEEAKHKIVIEADNGERFEIDPPELWDDDVFSVTGGPVAEAKAIMGAEEYARFRKAGGRATLVSFLIEQRMQGVTKGE
jgi:hypothetical protein